jgi:hypothetical protein
MESALLNDLFGAIDAKIFQIVLQLIVVGAIIMWIKDFNGRVVNYYKLKMSDFGRGTRVRIDGMEGDMRQVRFTEVEIDLGNGCTLLMPVEKFIKSSKVIVTTKRK